MNNSTIKKDIRTLQQNIASTQQQIANCKLQWRQQVASPWLIGYGMLASFGISFYYTSHQLTIDFKKWQKFASWVIKKMLTSIVFTNKISGF